MENNGIHLICPWWAGPVLNAALRKVFHDPDKIIKQYLSDGMTAMDIGCGMGFFTRPMSRLVGGRGKVIGVDVQHKMIEGLKNNAQKEGCTNITAHLCDFGSLHIEKWSEAVNFALLFWMLHEVPDAGRLINEVRDALSGRGKILLVEPSFAIGERRFQKSIDMICGAGFRTVDRPKIPISKAALLQKI